MSDEQTPLSLRMRRCCPEVMRKLEEKVREAPVATLAAAMGTGYVLSHFPLLRILGGTIRAGIHIAKPTLLILGAMKAADYVKESGVIDGEG